MKNNKGNTKSDELSAPLFGSWKRLYYFVFATLVFLIIAFYIFTKVFE